MSAPVPAALDAIVSALAAVPELSGVQVVDGPSLEWAQGDRIEVGSAADGPAAEAVEGPAGLGSRRSAVDVYCVAVSWTGDVAVKPRRDRAYQILDAVRGELRRDQTLSGRVARAQLVSDSYVADQTGQGLLVAVEFTVRVDAFH